MKSLLEEKDLIWSAVVANIAMNRDRNASGINSYEKEFKFIPAAFLEKKIEQRGHAAWLDICCGSGWALMQTAAILAVKGLQQKASLTGIDLLDTFPPLDKNITCLQWEVRSVVNWQPQRTYDLITCSHGLHYLGDKLQVIRMAASALQPHGYFVAHLDLQNIQVNGRAATAKLFTGHGFNYQHRNRLISCSGPLLFNYPCTYQGADDTTGPNYTGQGAVTSCYE
ncbi:class I SAM-dependent methyltransferase [Chitinophaga polysaccharea]|uniref:class I SAM-dependent methyltransferase n=1 Tax=Chitinophaga polysaccharea TaxID=1293035 RepID=UPI0014551A3E|nr:methyltransferase domain-containing protein [Chitinophaga polysaccharea]NLR58702.1 class I SAM-dependent methyltransferase [Chitinophaga polysaccharea]